jgi:hypothetical protein
MADGVSSKSCPLRINLICASGLTDIKNSDPAQSGG